jgi:hypothetical protein
MGQEKKERRESYEVFSRFDHLPNASGFGI